MNINKKRRICFVSIHSYPLFNSKCKVVFGGAEIQLFQIGKEISNNPELEVCFVVGDFGQSKEEVYKNIRVIKSFSVSRKRFKYIKGIFCLMKLFIILKKIDADLYVQRSSGLETGVIALFSNIFRKKFIYMTAHEIDCSGEFRKKNPIAGLFYEFGLSHANLVITQNKRHQQLLKINYGLDAPVLNSAYDIPAKRNKDGKYILWVARLDKWKNPEIFINLANFFPDEEFLMVAPISSDIEYGKEIQRKSKEVDNIRLIPGVPFTEINEYFRKAKIFINTSSYEGFPNTFVQAVMNGVPIISLNVNPDQVISKRNIGYFADNNPETLRDKLSILVNDSEVYKELSNNAYKYAKDSHDIKRISIQFISLINKINEK